MFKVICINSGSVGKTFDNKGNRGVYVPNIYVGSEYNVCDELIYNGKLFYELAEVQPDYPTKYMYESVLFGVLSFIDEAELIDSKEEIYG